MNDPDPREPIKPRPASDRSSLIRVVLYSVVIIAAGVGAFVAFVPMGILYSVAAVAALVKLGVESIRRSREGRPIDLVGKMKVFSESFGGMLLVLISAAIAFAVTCFPIGLIRFEGDGKMTQVAIGAGVLAALIVGGGVSFLLIRRSRARATKHRSEEV